MEVFSSLLAITVCALLAPLIAHTLPHRVVPETVLLIALGIAVGPAGTGWVHVGPEISLLSELGLAFLFLLAGYEVDMDDLRSGHGVRATLAWLVSFALALLVVEFAFDASFLSVQGTAIAIAMTSTALGTLMPILKERRLENTAVGRIVMTHGTVGEMLPIIAIALLLSSGSLLSSLGVLAIFALTAVLLFVIPNQARRWGLRVVDLIRLRAEGTAQTTVRLTVVLLVGLSTLAVGFKLDLVLGAFSAGLIVRQLLPQGRKELDQKLDGLAYGFFIPLFFVVSGTQIDLRVIVEQPLFLTAFFIALMLVRGVPVFISTHGQRPGYHPLTLGERGRIGLYSTTALPIIVAVTHVAVSADAMGEETASTLVLGGTLSVLVMPVLAAIMQSRTRTSDMDPDDPEDIEEELAGGAARDGEAPTVSHDPT
ncbi:MAG: cation:proton antiporter [Bowdeniella nasicola]|nr:cation:proton antiporter [Bowdeniella nasicola]